MHVVVTYVMTVAFMLVTLFIFGERMIGVFDDQSAAWEASMARREERADTRITGPSDLSVSATSTAELILANEGDLPLASFSSWDVIFEVQRDSGLDLAYMTHTDSASPGANQWTVKGIYLDATAGTGEIVDPGVLNPGEEMIVLAGFSSPLVANKYGRATLVTPNGVVTKVIFKVVP